MKRVSQFFVFHVWVVLPLVSQAAVHHQWTWELPARHGAWEEVQRIGADRNYPVFLQGGLALVSCEYNGALLALDAKTGAERWRFYTAGPLREEAAGDGERIFVASSDGFLYCLDRSGTLLWKKRGGPSNQKVIGHQRIVSPWLSEAAPVVKDGVVYYFAGYWPLEGIFLHALEARSGKTIWTNSALQVRGYQLFFTESGRLAVRGHSGGAMVDARTGQLVNEKMPKPPPPNAPKVEGLSGLLAAWQNDRYLTVSDKGEVRGYGPEKVEPKTFRIATGAPRRDARADDLLAQSKVESGYVIVAGMGDGALLEGLLAAKVTLRLVAFDDDPLRVEAVRHRLDQRGLLDHRVALMTTESAQLPPYLGSLVVANTQRLPKAADQWTRPYNGVRAAGPGDWKITVREDAPKGSADWRQEFADAGNTLASSDSLVKAPLGVSWYGGPAGAAKYYYDGDVDHQSGHGLNPQPVPAQIVAGRLILQAPALLSAFDQYTGRLLWETPLPTLYTFGGGGGGLGKHSKKHPQPWNYEGAMDFEVKPTQRARASGFNFASLPDSIYVCAAENLLRFDPASGKRLSSWPVPLDESGLCWGGLRVEGDVLVATIFRPQDLADAQAGHDGNGGEWAGDRMPMAYLIALDRQSGRKLWHRPAIWGYINRSGFCIGSGKVFCVDALTGTNIEKWKEAGRRLPTTPPRLLALDLQTGRGVWSRELKLLVRNIAYSAKRDLLLAPCRNLTEWRDGTWVRVRKSLLKDPNKNDPGLMRGLRGSDGEVVWTAEGRPYHHPHVILNDLIIDRHGYVYDLLSGERVTRPSPLTGAPELWSFRKSGCTHLVACDNLVTWRTAFYDLDGGSGVMKLTGLDAGCSPTLLPAGGLLNIPNFGTHHKRNRMTAMALVHRPGSESWTHYYTSNERPTEPEKPAVIKRAGYNFGAPGDQKLDQTLWLHVDGHARAGLSIEPRNQLRWLVGRSARTGSPIASSALSGVESVRIPVMIFSRGKGEGKDRAKRRYTIRLHFAELEAAKPGERVFDVKLEGQTLLEQFDIAKEAGGPNRPLVREFPDVTVEGELNLECVARRGQPLLAGVELILNEP